MIHIDDNTTIDQAFAAAATRFSENVFLVSPANSNRAYDPQGREIRYSEALAEVNRLRELYQSAGYGMGHRIGLLLENRLEHLLHKLAINSLGACCVPVNPDYRTRELIYLFENSRMDLLIVLSERKTQVLQALKTSSHAVPLIELQDCTVQASKTLPKPKHPAASGVPQGSTPASILYTSGTTGQPKGCVLSHTYELAAGRWYAQMDGSARVLVGQHRLYNPLPLFHVNASILSFYCMMLTGGAQIQTDRFQPSRFWQEVQQSRATIFHYLGVVIPMLLSLQPSPLERTHNLRFGLGAGVEPQLHKVFEERCGTPLIEVWGMTEMVRPLSDCIEPRQVGTRAFGRARPGLDAVVLDEQGVAVPDETPGELAVRHSAATPRKHFFSEYLDNPEATEDAWRGGWFHTGDVVYRAPDGMFHFMDRRKNIIRRSGENIAAAEVEALLLMHPLVSGVAVLAVPDDVREEEVLACVVLKQGLPEKHLASGIARELFDFCHAQLAYYKAPGWLFFTSEIPTTGTQKIQKHRLFPQGTDPRTQAAIHDLRAFKKRVTTI